MRIEVSQLPPVATEPNILTWPKRIAKSRIRVHTTILGEPQTKKRPRFTAGGRVYTPKQTKEAEEWIGWQIKDAYRGLLPSSSEAFGVRFLAYQKTQQRRDVDNIAKLIFDACTGIIWEDDSQVIELIAHIFKGGDEDKTELCIYSLGSLNFPSRVCPVCGKKFRVYPSWEGKIYCSQACRSLGERSGLLKTCAHCGKTIYRAPHRLGSSRNFYCSQECKIAHTTVELQCEYCGRIFRRARSLNKAGRKFCSEECQAAFWREHKAKQARGVCMDCGNPTSKKSYKRCRACFIASKRFRFTGRQKILELDEIKRLEEIDRNGNGR